MVLARADDVPEPARPEARVRAHYCPECGKRLRLFRRCDHLAQDGHPIQLRSQYPVLPAGACGAYFSPSLHPSTIVHSRCVLPAGHEGSHKQRMVQR